MKKPLKNCKHKLMRDYFSELPGVRRAIPGNVYCPRCRQPLPMQWNNGQPIPVNS